MSLGRSRQQDRLLERESLHKKNSRNPEGPLQVSMHWLVYACEETTRDQAKINLPEKIGGNISH